MFLKLLTSLTKLYKLCQHISNIWLIKADVNTLMGNSGALNKMFFSWNISGYLRCSVKRPIFCIQMGAVYYC